MRLRRTPLVLTAALALWAVTLQAQRGGGGLGPVATLKGVAVPTPGALGQYVADERMLVVLGKALFWDVQVGSDGQTACATCHFHAGADHRVQNQLASPANASVDVTPNTTLRSADFPFHAFSNPADNRSTPVRQSRLVAGSAGLTKQLFVAAPEGLAADQGAEPLDRGPFVVGDLGVRQVTARNAPSVINAVFNIRNFWDGRASDLFTGPTPFGESDTRLNVLTAQGGQLVPQGLRLDRASLASQAVGPALNAVEMSYDGRAWPQLGRRVLSLRPLARQQVAGDDSVLGRFAHESGTGLRDDVSYPALVMAAFQPAYWSSGLAVDLDGRTVPPVGDAYSQMAYNFPLFFGLAIQAYEATLVADDTPVDRFLAGDTAALSALEQQGLNQFRGGGAQCTQCHRGAEFSAAGTTTAARTATDPRALGFFRIGVSAVGDDAGAAGTDGFGRPLFPAAPGTRADGAFKTPQLRNVELTGPYFHTGGAATLEQVLEFYARNGDVPAGGNLGPGIGNIRLTPQERTEIAAMLRALTDERVRFDRAPFDHPSLCVPAGYDEAGPGRLQPEAAGGSARAADRGALIPAVGRGGHAAPLQTFQELLDGVGLDGSRAHTLQVTCTP